MGSAEDGVSGVLLHHKQVQLSTVSYFEIDDGDLVDVFNDMLYRLTICYNLQNSQG